MVAEIVNHLPSKQNAGQTSDVHDLSVQLPLAYPVGLLEPSIIPTPLDMLFDKQAYNEPQQVLLPDVEQGLSCCAGLPSGK